MARHLTGDIIAALLSEGPDFGAGEAGDQSSYALL